MTKTAEQPRRYVILDSDGSQYKRYQNRRTVYVCRTADKIAQIYDQELPKVTWISYAQKYTDELLRVVCNPHLKKHPAARRDEWLLTVAHPRAESVPSLHALFGRLVGDSPAYRWLPKQELLEILLEPAVDNSELFIAAAADPITKTLSLVRGDCKQIVVPFALFPRSGDGTKPDFASLRVTDYGRTIALGDYEASADAILYEADVEYRKSVNRRRRESERSFGASLLRLRKQRRLGRDDFDPLSAKTIARLERNEIEKPHGKTLQTIADHLGVHPDEIATY